METADTQVANPFTNQTAPSFTSQVDSANSYVALLKTSLVKPDSNLRIIAFANSRTFAVSDAAPGRLLELSRIQPRFGSWFIGDRVQQDGSVLITNPVNPLYVLLPNLLAERRPVPLDSLLSAHAATSLPLDEATSALLSELARDEHHVRTQLRRVCDTVSVPGTDLEAFSLNRGRLLDWLVSRVRASRAVLEREHLASDSGPQQRGAADDNNAADSPTLAFQLVARQLPPIGDDARALRRELHERLSQEGFFDTEKEASASTSTPGETDADGAASAPASETATQTGSASGSGANSRKVPGPKSGSVKARQMAAAAKGSASISSFFGPR